MRSCMSKESTVKMKGKWGKQCLLGRRASKNPLKLPNLIKVKAGRRIPGKGKQLKPKSFSLAPLPADRVNGPPVEMTFQSRICCLPENEFRHIYNALQVFQ